MKKCKILKLFKIQNPLGKALCNMGLHNFKQSNIVVKKDNRKKQYYEASQCSRCCKIEISNTPYNGLTYRGKSPHKNCDY